MDWHSMNYREICKNLDTDIKKGLSSEQVNSRLEKYGKNTLTQKKKQSVFMKFLSQFKDFMVLILLIASGISFATAFLSGDGDFIDPVMILIIVILH